MAIHCYSKYLFLVIIVFGMTYCVDKPNCELTRNFIEPTGTANLPLTKEWFIWGQLFSYCLQGDSTCSSQKCQPCLTPICSMKYTNVSQCKSNCPLSGNSMACEMGCIFYDQLLGGNSSTIPLNASYAPQTPLGTTASVIEKTFLTLTFEWNGANSALSNVSSVYLMTLKTSAPRKEEERVLGLIQATDYKLTEQNICRNRGTFLMDEKNLQYQLVVYPMNYHGNGTKFQSEKTVPRRLPQPTQLELGEPTYMESKDVEAVKYDISWRYDISDSNVSEAFEKFEVFRKLEKCASSDHIFQLSELNILTKDSPKLNKSTVLVYTPKNRAAGCNFSIQIYPVTKICLHGEGVFKNFIYSGCGNVSGYPQELCYPPTTTPQPDDEKVKPPSLNVSNFRCMEKNETWCSINKTSNSCPRCLNFTLFNTTTVNCIICEKAMVDVFVSWTRPRTFSPIIEYTMAYGGKTRFLDTTSASETTRKFLPDITNYTVENLTLPVKSNPRFGTPTKPAEFGVTVHARTENQDPKDQFKPLSADYTYVDVNGMMNPLRPRYIEPIVTTTPQTGEPMGKKGPDEGLIVGIVFGMIALLLLITVVLMFLRRSRRQPKLINRDIEVYMDSRRAIVTDEWEIFPTDITLDEKIGEGAFGTVFSAFVDIKIIKKSKYAKLQGGSTLLGDKSCKVAVKLLKEHANHMELDDFREEIKLMKTIGYHRNIVNLVGSSTINKPLCLIVEYMPNGDLLHFLRQRRSKLCMSTLGDESNAPGFMYTQNYQDSLIQTSDSTFSSNTRLVSSGAQHSNSCVEGDVLTPDDLISFSWQIACGMEYLAQNNLVHRDLAARNILVGNDNAVKISDFGLTRKVSSEMIYMSNKNRRLPVKWMSVEAIFDQVFTVYSDVWAYGVVLFEIVTLGGTPYPTINNRELLRLLKSGYRMEKPENCADPMYDIMLHCWNEDPLQRPTFTELREHLDDIISAGDKYFTFDINEENTYYNVASFKSVSSENEEDEMVVDELMKRPMQVKTIDELKQIQQRDENADENLTPEDIEEERKLAEKVKALEGDQLLGKEDRYKKPQSLISSDEDKLKGLEKKLDITQKNDLNARYITQQALKNESANSEKENQPSHIYINQDDSTLAVA